MFKRLLISAMVVFISTSVLAASFSAGGGARVSVSPSASFSRPSISVAPSVRPSIAPAPSAPAASFSRPSVTTAAPAARTTVSGTPVEQSAQKTVSSNSLAQYRSTTAPVNTSQVRNDPLYSKTMSQYKTPDQYITHRTTVITNYRTIYPHSYGWSVGFAPHYGMYDSSFLMGMLIGEMGASSINSAWLYYHQNDPWYNQWHNDAIEQAKTNAELKAKLDAMDAQLSAYKSAPPPPVADLPPNIDPTAAISPDVVNEVAVAQSSGPNVFMFVLGTLLIFLIIIIPIYLYRKGKSS